MNRISPAARRRICLPTEEFTGERAEVLEKLLTDKRTAQYIASLKVSASMIIEESPFERLHQFYRPPGYSKRQAFPIIADLSLSGGYSDMAKHVASMTEKFAPRVSFVTFAQGATIDAIGYVIRNVKSERSKRVNFLLTGPLPENDKEAFEAKFKTTLEDFTSEQVSTAQITSRVHGVYANAGLAIPDAFLEIGVGVSMHGEAYISGEVEKEAVSFTAGLENCRQLITGNGVLFRDGISVFDSFAEIGEMIEDHLGGAA